jgi:phage shock protein C
VEVEQMTPNTYDQAPMSEPATTPPPAPPDEAFTVRRVHRSRRDRVFAGVCGGLAEYFGVDAVLLRIVAVALALSGGAGLLLYVIAWIAMPEDTTTDAAERQRALEPSAGPVRQRATAATIAGAVLVAAGALMLLNQLLPWMNVALLWPLVVIAGGIAVLMSGRRQP